MEYFNISVLKLTFLAVPLEHDRPT